MTIRPLKTEADYQAALTEVERLFDAQPNTAEADYLDVLTILVSVYEDEHYAIPEPDPIEAIKYYMESRGLTRSDLVRFMGSRERVAAVLNRSQRLSIGMIRKLHAELGIPAEVLIQPYALGSARTDAGKGHR